MGIGLEEEEQEMEGLERLSGKSGNIVNLEGLTIYFALLSSSLAVL